MKPPIIYTHYSHCSYLGLCFVASKHTNPDRRIILIGDDANTVIFTELSGPKKTAGIR